MKFEPCCDLLINSFLMFTFQIRHFTYDIATILINLDFSLTMHNGRHWIFQKTGPLHCCIKTSNKLPNNLKKLRAGLGDESFF